MPDWEVLYCRINADLMDEIRQLAQLNERSIVSVVTILLNRSLNHEDKHTLIWPR